MPAVDFRLIAARGDDAAVGEVRRARGEPGHALEYVPKRRAAESAQFVLADHRDHSGRVRLALRKLRRGDDLDVEERFQIELQQIARGDQPRGAARCRVLRGCRRRRTHDQHACRDEDNDARGLHTRQSIGQAMVQRARGMPWPLACELAAILGQSVQVDGERACRATGWDYRLTDTAGAIWVAG